MKIYNDILQNVTFYHDIEYHLCHTSFAVHWTCGTDELDKEI